MSTPSSTVIDVKVAHWPLPLIAPFRVATRTAYHANNILVKITSQSGISGYGAAAPVEYITGETCESVMSSIGALIPELTGNSCERLKTLLDKAAGLLPESPSASAAVEMAIYDLWAKHWGLPLWQYFGGSMQRLFTDITIPIVGNDEARALTLCARAEGFNIFKIKIGDSEGCEADLRRIETVREAAPDARLRIDANQAFTPADAVAFVRKAQHLSPAIDLIEQPVAKEDFDGLRYVKDRIDVPLFADESARSYEDAVQLIDRRAVDGINIKLMKSGIRQALDIAQLCQRNNLRLMIGCMLESPLGIAAAGALAGGFGGFEFIDLDSHKLLSRIPGLRGPFQLAGPRLELDAQATGWGVEFLEV